MPVKVVAHSSEGTYDYACLRRRYSGSGSQQSWVVRFTTSTSDVTPADEWDEIERMAPRGQRLIRLADQFPAPYDWD